MWQRQTLPSALEMGEKQMNYEWLDGPGLMTQDEYMDILFNELGFDTKTLKIGFINKRIMRLTPRQPVKYL